MTPKEFDELMAYLFNNFEDNGNPTGLAESAADAFDLCGPAPKYDIPEWLYDLAQVAEQRFYNDGEMPDEFRSGFSDAREQALTWQKGQ